MSDVREIPPETIATQRRASDPAGSAWVSANAGSGKTFVLTRRVVRLLLGGVAPSRILCLTFTKAAAAHMAIEVFKTLAAWVAMDDAALAAAIVDTGAPPPGRADLAFARRLFARTVETPGGLKILTIHAFCEKVLHAFPFEANVAARFTVIEEIRQQDLLSRAREATIARAVAEPSSPVGRALESLAGSVSDFTFDLLVQEVASHAVALRETIEQAGGVDGLAGLLADALGTGGTSVAEIERSMLEDGVPRSEWDGIGRHLVARGRGSPVGERLVKAARAPRAVEAYLDVFFNADRSPKGILFAKPLRAAEPALCARLDRECERLAGLLAARLAAAAAERTVALLTVGHAIIDTYETMKRRRGLLDFGDLIERTRILLSRSDSAWVLYKLDSGIDHVLVDEAQDTSPEQWEILRAISRDFFAGEGQSRTNRTFFAVGDEKQSIYSFQGARPAMFDATRRDYAKRAHEAGRPFAEIELLLSFRSVKTVLDIVDKVFKSVDNRKGLSAGAEQLKPHEALKQKLPGLVEIWPKVGPKLAPEPSDWRLPVDLPDANAPAVIVARRVADTVARMIAPGSTETVHDGRPGVGRRAVRAGDILILVRSRNAFFDAVIRALKEGRVPVAGADRLNLTTHIAVMDLMAAGRAALLPDDDLTLACVLKSPLIGLDDDDLLRLAPERSGSLGEALRASPHENDRAAEQRLAIWRDRAATLTPFGFYTRLLGQDGGRKALLGRLGPEAGDVIDEFMALTLAHERDGAPSLLAFLARLEGVERSIKRDLDAAGDAVRVMTVHAAKGLEAKIVFLPDTCTVPDGRHDPKLFGLAGVGEAQPPLLVWSPRVDTDPAAVAASRAAGREAALDEHRRLLYVALTRAQERLYVAGFHGEKGPGAGCWYDMIVAAEIGGATVPAPWDPAEVIHRRSDPMDRAPPMIVDLPPPEAALPEWITRPARPELPVAPPVRPSNALGAADQPDRDEADPARGRGARSREATAVGRLMHRLLQHLPDLEPALRREAGLRFLVRQGRLLVPDRHAALVDDAIRVIDDPALAALFGPGSQAEVAVAANVALADGRRVPVTGQIDRIGLTVEAVFIADYKTGEPRPAAAAPPSYVAQLALYRAAVRPLYPGRAVRAFLVWTSGPGVTEIAPGALDAALHGLAAG